LQAPGKLMGFDADQASGDGARRLHFLDGLRGWAALIVVFFHANWELFKEYDPQVQSPGLGLLNDGKLAVYVFFVLSGVVLSYPYLSTLNATQLTKLALRRYVRLTIPIAAASFLGFVMLEKGWFFHRQASAIVQSHEWLATFYPFAPSFSGWARFATYDVFFRYRAESSYDFVLWTMQYELAGSFLVFGLLAIGGKSVAARAICYGTAALLCRWEAPILLGFVFGCIIAEAMLAPVLRRSALFGDIAGTMFLALAFVGSALLRDTYSPQRCAWLALMIVGGVVMSSRWRALLASPVSRWLGRISFPLYLLHPLIICGPASLLIFRLTEWGWSGSALVGPVSLFIVISSLIAAALFAPVERAAITTSHVFSRFVLEADERLRRRFNRIVMPKPAS
jgi:peptidoglycan/LPS O-acetylase OafA/YrhL